MFNNLHSLELTSADIKLIEAALHTQKKILSVQSEAGRSGTNLKLSELNRLIKRLDRSVTFARQETAAPLNLMTNLIESLSGHKAGFDQPR